MALFRRPSHYHGEDVGGAAVAVAEPEAVTALPTGNTPEAEHPYAEQIAALDRDDAALTALEEEYRRLTDARDESLAGVRRAKELLDRSETPAGAVEMSDEEIELAGRSYRSHLRWLGQHERELTLFTGVHTHASLLARRERLTAEREAMQKNVHRWSLEREWFTSLAPELEAVFLKLADWHMRRVVANRAEGIVLNCGVHFADPGFGPLSEELVRRAFRFDRAYNGKEPVGDIEKQVTLARERNIFPSRLYVGWR
jgi:hypothetical protein